MKGVLEYVSHVLGMETGSEVPARMVVGVYYAAVVLHTFISGSAQLAQFTRKHFKEEFKYVVTPSCAHRHFHPVLIDTHNLNQGIMTFVKPL